MRKKLFLSIILVFVTLSNLFSQYKVIGKITNNDNEPLDGVNIYVKKLNRGVISNDKGEYSLELPNGDFIISFSFVGYEMTNKELNIDKPLTKLNVRLQEDVSQLEGIEIIAKSEARKIREKAMPVSVISMNQLSGTVNSISDVLNKTVGVTIRSSGGVGAASRLSVRGLEGKRVGFFIDEIPMNDNSDFIDINDMPMEIIERIEIFKGVVPAKFGGNAMGGAVNIVVKEYPEKYGDFNYELGSFNSHRFSTIFKRNLKDKGLLLGIGAFHTYSDNDYTMESPHIKGLKIKREHDNFKKWMIGGSIEATKLWFDKIYIEPVFIDTYKEIQGIEYDVRKAHTKSRAYVLGNGFEKDDFFIEGLDFDLSNALAYTQYSLIDTANYWYDWEGVAYLPNSNLGGELGNRYTSNSDNKKLTYTNKLNLEYIINQNHSINFNSYFTLANGNPKDELRELSMGKKAVFDSKMRSLTVGFTYDFRANNDKFLNSFTTRYYIYTMNSQTRGEFGFGEIEDIEVEKDDIGFSNAMRYRFTQTLLAKISAGYDVRIPSETELLGDGNLVQPSESLLPERNKSLNIGVIYDLLGKSKNNLQVELNGFYMHLEDMIRYTKSPWGGAKYENFGEMRSIGVELEMKADILPTLYSYGNITYQDLRDVREYEENSTVVNPTKDKRMPNIPYLMSNVGLEFHKENLFGGNGQNTRIFIDLSFIEEYYYDFEMTNDQRRIPRSTAIDLSIEHSFMSERMFISAKLKNLTDSKILSEFNRPLPGRNFGIKLRYILK